MAGAVHSTLSAKSVISPFEKENKPVALTPLENLQLIYSATLNSNPGMAGFVGHAGFFSYSECQTAKIFFPPVPSGLEHSDGGRFYTNALARIRESTRRWSNKYLYFEKGWRRLFDSTFMLLEDQGISKQNKESGLKRIHDELTELLKNKDGLYEDLRSFQIVLETIEPLSEFLKSAGVNKICPTCTAVAYPNVFGGGEILIEKGTARTDAECALLESFYRGYSLLINMHIRYVNELIFGIRLLRSQLPQPS